MDRNYTHKSLFVIQSVVKGGRVAFSVGEKCEYTFILRHYPSCTCRAVYFTLCLRGREFDAWQFATTGDSWLKKW